MIICMNYSNDGSRYIALVEFVSDRLASEDAEIARDYSQEYEEVYMIPFIPTKELVNEIVLNGCRM